MIKSKYKKIMNCPMTEEMFNRIKGITDEEEISYAAFMREAITEKLGRLDNDKPDRDTTV